MSIGPGEDEAAAGPAVSGPADHSMDRRSLIKKVGIAGAAAWVAPVVIESMVSPASAASIPPGTYRLRLSSQACNPTPVQDPNAALPPASCGTMITDFPATTFAVTSQQQLDALGITVANCLRRFAIQLTSSNPKVTFTAAGSGSGSRHPLLCVTPALTPSQVTWLKDGVTDRNGYFVIINVAP